jgi:FMN phosphatase YigB (HAD superfamily)
VSRIRAVIFDLDNCLAAADEAGEELFAPAFDAIRAANKGRLSENQLSAAFADAWRHALDHVARKHDFSDEMYRAGFEVFRRLEVKRRLRGYGDLGVLQKLRVRRILVTSGFRRLQESKIEALGIRGVFEEIHVHAIDEQGSPGKKDTFGEILARRGWRAEEVLVVGDNAESEIAAGNALGMPTVQVLRPGVPHAPAAARHIKGLDELLSFV